MRKLCAGRNVWKDCLWSTGMVIVLMIAAIWYWVVAFDTDERTSDWTEQNQPVYFVGGEISETADSWETIIVERDDPDQARVFTGMTFACGIKNDNNFDVKDWKLRINILNPCYLSGFWCGSFEVHQFRNGEESVNFVENQMTDVSEMNIDQNPYSDNTMIHLLPGDYLVYIPSVNEKEDTVEKQDEVGIGFIFYFQESIDLSQWSLTYKNDLKMYDLPLAKITLLCVILWTAALVFYLLLEHMASKLKAEMQNRTKTISIMADLFYEAYIIDLEENTAQLVKGDEKNLVWNLPERNVQEAINERIYELCQGICCEELVQYLDLSTVMARLSGKTSISSEYYDELFGWCLIRLFKVGGDTEKSQIVFALQDINEEKKKLRAFEDRINLAEYKQNVSGSFLETVSFALNDISAKISEDGKAILKESTQEDIRTVADRIVMNTRHMNLIQNVMIDLYELECGSFKLDVHPYNIHEVMEEIHHILHPFADEKDFEFSFDVDAGIPTALLGDPDRIEQIIVIILFSSILMTQKGYVKFSVFGKQNGDEEDLIFSIRDTAMGFTEDQLTEIHQFINGKSVETFDNASLVYLKTINGILFHMGSELKIVSVVNEGSDFYFSIKQKVVD